MQKRRKFVATFSVEIEVDQSAIDRGLSEEFRKEFYDFRTEMQVAAHLAYNLMRGAEIRQLDGFADMPESVAHCQQPFEEDCTEIAPKGPVKTRTRVRRFS